MLDILLFVLNIVSQVRDCCDKYTNIFVYDVVNTRNTRLKEIRTLWSDSRFFYGKNRVMQLALGKTEAEEYREGLHHVTKVKKLLTCIEILVYRHKHTAIEINMTLVVDIKYADSQIFDI